MRITRHTLTAALAALAIVTGACGEKNEVGDQSLLDFEEQLGDRLGETTTTTAAPTTTTTLAPAAGSAQPGEGRPTPQPTVTTATTAPPRVAVPAPTTTTTAPPAQRVASVEIGIYGDNAPAPVEPQYARVFVGGIVRWVNHDTVARSVSATTGQFRSPPIPPGEAFEYKATTAGIFDYADGSRPYVTATLEVLPQG